MKNYHIALKLSKKHLQTLCMQCKTIYKKNLHELDTEYGMDFKKPELMDAELKLMEGLVLEVLRLSALRGHF